MKILEFLGIAFDISNASPKALFFVLLTNRISSIELDAHKNAIDVPTLPDPMIEIR